MKCNENKKTFYSRITNQICLKLKMINYIYIFLLQSLSQYKNKCEIVVY